MSYQPSQKTPSAMSQSRNVWTRGVVHGGRVAAARLAHVTERDHASVGAEALQVVTAVAGEAAVLREPAFEEEHASERDLCVGRGVLGGVEALGKGQERI